MKYTVVIEKGDTGFGAFVPDLPGCIAVAGTREELLPLIREAIRFHMEGLIAGGGPVPEPRCDFTEVE